MESKVLQMIDKNGQNYFFDHVAKLAATMRYVSPERLNPEELGVPHWYIGGDEFELYLIEENDLIKSFYMIFYNHYFEYQMGKVQVGFVDRREALSVLQHKSSDLIEFHSRLDSQIIESLEVVISNINKMKLNFKEQVFEIISVLSKKVVSE